MTYSPFSGASLGGSDADADRGGNKSSASGGNEGGHVGSNTGTHTHTHIHTRMGYWGGCWIGSRRVGRGCGRRLGMGSGFVFARRSIRCVRGVPRGSLSIYLSIYLSRARAPPSPHSAPRAAPRGGVLAAHHTRHRTQKCIIYIKATFEAQCLPRYYARYGCEIWRIAIGESRKRKESVASARPHCPEQCGAVCPGLAAANRRRPRGWAHGRQPEASYGRVGSYSV